MTSAFDLWLDRFIDPEGPGAAVAVELGGERLYEGARGLANLEWRWPIDSETVFRIASVSKQFTAAAIVRLAEAGRLGFDDPITRHLPSFGSAGDGVTIRHLLSHQSGLGQYTEDPHFMAREVRNDHTTAEMVAVIRSLAPEFEPGARALYNNSGYLLLGAIIEGASGRSYADYLSETFFRPLGLAHTRYLHDYEIISKRGSGYAGGPGGDWANAPPIAMTNPHGAGGLGSTVGDLLIWSRALHEGRVVGPAGYQAMITPGRPRDGRDLTRGFGLFRHELRGEVVICHSGSVFGFAAHLAHWPAHDLTVAALANSNPFPIEQLAYGLARRALGQDDAAYGPVEISQPDQDAAAGRFVFPNDEVVELRPDGMASSFARPDSPYRAYGPDRFFLTDDPEVTFRFADPERRELILQDYRTPKVGTRRDDLG